MVHCALCKRVPKDIYEYKLAASKERVSAEMYVRLEEGTFDSATGLFWCTVCYIKLGCPLGTAKVVDAKFETEAY